MQAERRSVAAPATLLGVGLGGFVDGIVLHQILQWHHMISSTTRGSMTTVGGLENNTLADGLFHAGTWVVVAIALWLLWRGGARGGTAPRDRAFVGYLLLGWGLFNVVDEAVFHALLDLHHIREGDNELLYDLAFLTLGLLQIAAGIALAATASREAARARR